MFAVGTENSTIFLEALISAAGSDRNFRIGQGEVKDSG